MRDLLADAERLLALGAPVGRAVVTSVWGSAPRPEGACLLATAEGVMAGSVSGGCVEGATVGEIGEAIRRGTPKLITFGVSDETAWSVGLACGGTIKVFVEPTIRAEALEAARSVGGVVLATIVEGPASRLGDSWLIRDDAPAGRDVPAAVAEAAVDALAREASRSIEIEAVDGQKLTVFLEVFPRLPRLIIFGAVQIAVPLVRLARMLGYRTVVVDGRAAFLTRERFPDADELILDWPGPAFERIGLDRSSYVCILSHDPKFDDPGVELALRSPAKYVGAIGSRKTQAQRRERLRTAGFSDADLERLHGPIGLDIGGRMPAETALAIMAEVTGVRYGRR
ncbi:MAG: XdhC/CoxI family protein [Gemmatimonadota bacterium]